MKQATVVMVAHRLNTLRRVDRIYRIDSGEAFAYDSYEQMMKETAGQEVNGEHAIRFRNPCC